MRGLFYRHRRWQKLNVLLLVLALMLAFFFHAVLNAIAQSAYGSATFESLYPQLKQAIGDGQMALMFTSANFWTAQFSGFLSVFTQPTLWLSWLYLPLSIATILIVQALAALMNQPRWQTSTLLLIVGCIAAWALPLVVDVTASPQALAVPAQVGLFFALAAAWISGSRLRGHHSR